MKNWKTTLAGVVAFIPQVIAVFGLPVPIANLITAAAIAVGFFLAKDAGVTGTAK